MHPCRCGSFAERYAGPVLTPDHPSYEVARTTFNAMLDRHPAVIACCADESDIATAISFARDAELPLAVRGGGHSVAGHSTCDGGVVIDLRLIAGARLESGSRRVWAGGGAVWRSVDAITSAHQLAMPGGTFDTTGVAGLTLGGGIGYLMGTFGLALDNLCAATVVLADGSVVTASPDVEPELFWALRGGGGNFGVVSEFEFELHPLSAVWGGIITYPHAEMASAIRLFRDMMACAPDELMLICFLDRAVAPEGAASIIVCFAGSAADAEQAVRPLREHLPVFADELGLTSYLQIQVMAGDVPFGMRHYWKSQFVDALPDDLIDDIVAHYLTDPADGADVLLIEPMHGAALRVPRNATAFSRRSRCFNVSALATWESPAADNDHIAWSRNLVGALGHHSKGGYLNYGAPDEPMERVRAAYGKDNFGRLQNAKQRYDPDNVFRLNHNIPPSG